MPWEIFKYELYVNNIFKLIHVYKMMKYLRKKKCTSFLICPFTILFTNTHTPNKISHSIT